MTGTHDDDVFVWNPMEDCDKVNSDELGAKCSHSCDSPTISDIFFAHFVCSLFFLFIELTANKNTTYPTKNGRDDEEAAI